MATPVPSTQLLLTEKSAQDSMPSFLLIAESLLTLLTDVPIIALLVSSFSPVVDFASLMHQAYQDPEDQHSKEAGYLPLLSAHPSTHSTLDDCLQKSKRGKTESLTLRTSESVTVQWSNGGKSYGERKNLRSAKKLFSEEIFLIDK
ncbi:Cklf-Like Marvel Transmembrane Domain-Containing Protein 3 [Manis pentadactyla]|nr:Cklf-Like Marvel Transmembrane Domain-Containing Protein 3 [Manis pentadactyla]